MIGVQLAPIKGIELFPNTIEFPPVVRFTLQARTGFWWFEDPETVDAVAREAMQRYINQISNFVYAQRQHYANSTVANWKVQIKFDEALEVIYTNLHKQEYIDVIINVESYTNSPIIEELGLMLLVFYNTNSVAAIPMVKLSKPAQASAVYKATLKYSSWGEEQFKVCQLKAGKGVEIVYMALNLVDNVWSLSNVYNVFSNFASLPSALLRDAGNYQLARAKYYSDPIMNVTPGGTIYTPFDIYELNKNNIVRVGAPPVTDAMPYAIHNDGTYYYNLEAIMNCTGFGGLDFWSSVIGANSSMTFGTNQLPADISADYAATHYNHIFWGKNSGGATTAYVQNGTDGSYSFMFGDGFSDALDGPVPFPLYTKSGADHLNVITTQNFKSNADSNVGFFHGEFLDLKDEDTIQITSSPSDYFPTPTTSYVRTYVASAHDDGTSHYIYDPSWPGDPLVFTSSNSLYDPAWLDPNGKFTVTYSWSTDPDSGSLWTATIDGTVMTGSSGFLTEASSFATVTGSAPPMEMSGSPMPPAIGGHIWSVLVTYEYYAPIYTLSSTRHNYSWYLKGFPFAIDKKIGKSYFVDVDMLETGLTYIITTRIFTPYKVFTNQEAWPLTGTSYFEEVFDGWLHVSNGVHLIQGFRIADHFNYIWAGTTPKTTYTPHVYVNNTDFGPILEKILKTSIKNVQGMVMDVNLSLIKKFK